MRPALHLLLAAWVFTGVSARADEPLLLTARGTAQVAFTPGDDASALVVDAIRKARKQILVQAYGFTHKSIAQALVDARQRGVDVQVIADRQQLESLATTLVPWLAAQDVSIWIDADHAAAHNKVMVIDNGTPEPVLITGSFNFTHAAQHRNAENLLLLRGHGALVEAYAANWRRHKIHALPLRQ